MHGQTDVDFDIPIELIHELQQIIGSDGVLIVHSDRMVYECDGFTIEKNIRMSWFFQHLLNRLQMKKPATGTRYHSSTRCRLAWWRHTTGWRRCDVGSNPDERDRRDQFTDRYVVQPGVVIRLTHAKGTILCAGPSSQGACTIGGNVATNQAGLSLKYGVTVNHVLGVEAVSSDGEIFVWEDPTRIRADWI